MTYNFSQLWENETLIFNKKIPGFVTYLDFNSISPTDMCIITKSSKSDGDKNLAQGIHKILLGKC